MKKNLKIFLIFIIMFLLFGTFNTKAVEIYPSVYAVVSAKKAKAGDTIGVYYHLTGDCTNCFIWDTYFNIPENDDKLKNVLELVSFDSNLNFKIDEKTGNLLTDDKNPYVVLQNQKAGTLLFHTTYKIKQNAPIGDYIIGRMPGYAGALLGSHNNKDFDESAYETILTIVDDKSIKEDIPVEDSEVSNKNDDITLYFYILLGMVIILLPTAIVVIIKLKKAKKFE